MRILAVIPARGGSKGIPKKNIRLLNKKPLIAYSIENALKCKAVTDVVVTTDNDEIAYVAEKFGAEIIMRSSELAGDSITLDPVIYDALIKAEEMHRCTYDYVVTMQPTSPLLKVESLIGALKLLKYDKFDCIISVVNKPHLSWRQTENGLVPNYKKRLNRQLLPANFLETGAFVITRRSMITASTRMAGRVTVYPISDQEGIDIDNVGDWILCETILKRRRIIFRTDGYAALGMGHIYNCITLAYAMMEHDVLIVIRKDSEEGIKKIRETNLPYKIINDDDEIDDVIKEFKPDIWVNDRLNTDKEYICHLKKIVKRVITIEDLGSGTAYADAVINALYTDDDLMGNNVFNGWRYVCLRDEFQIEHPRNFSEKVSNVMLMFGGTDPSNYNKKLYDIIMQIAPEYPDVKFNFVVGIGYDNEKNGVKTVKEKNVFVYPNVKRVTKFMREADLAITSQGRSIFEFASMGVPAIVLSQNKRETSHSFASMRHGFINLGLGTDINPEVIKNTLRWLIETRIVRKNMHDIMIQYPLRDGLERVKGIILGNALDNTI